MQCLDRKTALDMADGRLPRDLEQAAQGHLEDCAECTALLATIVFSQTDVAAGAAAPAARRRDMPAIPAGTAIGRFVLGERLGAGAMGAIYRARDPQLARDVAIKVLHAGRGAADRDRLVREAQSAAQLNHPNVIAIYDVGRHDDEVYVAMELVEGQDLRGWLKGAAHPWPAIVSAFVDAGRGLAAAHAAGLVHRDFKPDNALRGDDGRVRVVDFGLASGVTDADHGPVVGTPMYMSPEQRAGDPVDPRSDQFSFCVALYHALYGNHPFSEGTHVALPPPSESPVPKAMFPIVARGLAEDPDARWPSMAELLDALDGVGAPSRLRPFAYLAGAAVLAAIIVAIAVVGFGGDAPAADEPAADDLSETERLRAEVAQLERDKQTAEAQRGFAVGQVHFEAEHYFAAAAEFADAFDTWPHAAFAFNVAKSYERAGHCPNALAWFRRYVEVGASEPDIADVRERIAALASECGEHAPSHAPGTDITAADVDVPDDACAALDAAKVDDTDRYRSLDWIGALERACKGR